MFLGEFDETLSILVGRQSLCSEGLPCSVLYRGKNKPKRKSCKRACMENIEHVFIAVNKQEINGIFFLTKQIDNDIYFIPISLFKKTCIVCRHCLKLFIFLD